MGHAPAKAGDCVTAARAARFLQMRPFEQSPKNHSGTALGEYRVGEASAAGGPRKLRFILNTFVSGPQAWFFVADERGYFRDAGLDVEMTPGDTLANAVPRVASGEFDAGYGDLNALIELAARGSAPDCIAVFATFNSSPYTIAVPAGSAVTTPRDLEDPAARSTWCRSAWARWAAPSPTSAWS
jgi:NMT1/THI5 like